MKNKEFLQQKKAACQFADCPLNKKKTEDRAGLLPLLVLLGGF